MLQVHYIQCLLCSCALLCSLSWSMIGFWCDLNSNNKYILAFPLYPNSYPIIYPLPCILTLFPNFIPWSYTLQPVWLAMVMMFMCLFITYSMWNNHSLQQCDVNISILCFISVNSTYTSITIIMICGLILVLWSQHILPITIMMICVYISVKSMYTIYHSDGYLCVYLCVKSMCITNSIDHCIESLYVLYMWCSCVISIITMLFVCV